MRLVNDYDREILARTAVGTAFGDESAECFAQGPDGLIADADLLSRTSAFDVEHDRAPGPHLAGNRRSPRPAPINKRVADTMPGAVWHEVEGAGHFVAVGEADDIFAVAAEDLGAERLGRPLRLPHTLALAVAEAASRLPRPGTPGRRGRQRPHEVFELGRVGDDRGSP